MNAIQKSAIAVLVVALTATSVSPATAADAGGGERLKIAGANQSDRLAARSQGGAGNADVLTWQDMLMATPLRGLKFADAIRDGATKLDNLDKADLLGVVSAPWLNWLKGKSDRLSDTNG